MQDSARFSLTFLFICHHLFRTISISISHQRQPKRFICGCCCFCFRYFYALTNNGKNIYTILKRICMQHLHVTIGNGQMSSESRATGRMSNMQSFTWRPQRPGFCLYRRMDFYILILTAAKAYCCSILLFVCGWREIKHITGSSGLSGEGSEALLVAASCCPAIFLFEISIYQAALLYSNA